MALLNCTTAEQNTLKLGCNNSNSKQQQQQQQLRHKKKEAFSFSFVYTFFKAESIFFSIL
jgi:hypothetical protein